jgi:hypothetical protein
MALIKEIVLVIFFVIVMGKPLYDNIMEISGSLNR